MGGKTVASHPLQLYFSRGEYLDAYKTRYKGLRMLGDDMPHGITIDNYTGSYYLYSFNLTPDKSDSQSHMSERKPAL